MYGPSGLHDDAHVKKENVSHLGFVKKWQKNFFQLFVSIQTM